MNKCFNCGEILTCESMDEDVCCECQGNDYDSKCSECRADHSADLADDSRKRSLEHPT